MDLVLLPFISAVIYFPLLIGLWKNNRLIEKSFKRIQPIGTHFIANSMTTCFPPPIIDI